MLTKQEKKRASYKKWYSLHYKDYYWKNIEKKRAKDAAKVAYEKGLIKREPCRDCGATEDLEKHHPDYSEPLNIVWLCRKCHMNDDDRMTRRNERGQFERAI